MQQLCLRRGCGGASQMNKRHRPDAAHVLPDVEGVDVARLERPQLGQVSGVVAPLAALLGREGCALGVGKVGGQQPGQMNWVGLAVGGWV